MSQDEGHGRPGASRPRTDRLYRSDLGELSRRFVARVPDASPRAPVDNPGSDSASPAAPTPAPVLLRPWPVADDGELAALLRGATEGIETGLVPIDNGVACRPHGRIDLLAVDQSGQLVIVDFDLVSADALVLRALRHFDWVVQHLALLRRIYAYVPANYARPPRLLLLAPSVPRATAQATRHFAAPRLEWIRYQVLDAAGAPALLFERVTADA